MYRSSFQGQSIYASTYGYDGCVSTWMDLNAVVGRVKTDGRPTQSSTVGGSISQYNYCESYYMYGNFSTELDESAIQIDRQFQHATLTVSAYVCDYECFPATIQLTWTGTGDTTHEKSHYQNQSPQYKSIYRFDGETRRADISGSVTTPWGTTNLLTSYAVIQSLKNGSMTIYKWS